MIENTKEMETIDAHDVVAILKGYEQRLNRHSESNNEKAFASIDLSSKQVNRGTNQVGGSKFQKRLKSKGKQWPNRTTTDVKQWQGNNIINGLARYMVNYIMVNVGTRGSQNPISAVHLDTVPKTAILTRQCNKLTMQLKLKKLGIYSLLITRFSVASSDLFLLYKNLPGQPRIHTCPQL